MDAKTERLYAVGPGVSAELLAPLALATVPIDGWDGIAPIHYISSSGCGSWLIAGDRALIDRAILLLGKTYFVVTMDAWNSFERKATVGRAKTERHREGACEVEMVDRYHPDLARAGVLPEVALEWLRALVHKLGKPAPHERGPTKAEQQRAVVAQAVIAWLHERSLLVLAPDSTVKHLVDRTQRVLFTISTSRTDAIAKLLFMLRDTKHVTAVTAVADDLRQAFAAAGYRRR